MKQSNESGILLNDGEGSNSILVQIEDLSRDQNIRLGSLKTKYEDALNPIRKLDCDIKARLLRLGELQRPDRAMDWENDTEDGEKHVLKHGFEDGNNPLPKS